MIGSIYLSKQRTCLRYFYTFGALCGKFQTNNIVNIVLPEFRELSLAYSRVVIILLDFYGVKIN